MFGEATEFQKFPVLMELLPFLTLFLLIFEKMHCVYSQDVLMNLRVTLPANMVPKSSQHLLSLDTRDTPVELPQKLRSCSDPGGTCIASTIEENQTKQEYSEKQ